VAVSERLARAHEALLHRFLAYAVGALAGFLPLIEFSIMSDSKGRLGLPFWPSVLFVVVGSLVTTFLTGAALVSFRQALALEHRLGLKPSELGTEFVTGSWTARFTGWLYDGSMSRSGRTADHLVDLGVAVVAILTVWIDLTLPWGITFPCRL
jgi:hypothetical protein